MTRGFGKSRRALVYAALVMTMLGASCDSKRTPRDAGRSGTLVVGLLSDPKTLNPLAATSVESRQIVELLFLKLMEEQSDFSSFRPMLAASWEFGPDSLDVTFRLRDDVVWADGAPVTAEDVRFTWELQTDTLVAWPSRSVKERIEGVEVIDEHTVKFRFSQRHLYQLMDANDGVVLPEHLLAGIPRNELRVSDFGRYPVGNGPFRLARWESGQYVELERNPLYHEKGLPRLDRVVFRIVPDMVNLVTQLKAGEIDCLESLPLDAVRDIRANHPEIEVYTYPSRHQVFIAWNLQQPRLSSREVRRALAMAIDRDEMIRSLWGGMAEPSESPMHPILWAHDPGIDPVRFDPGLSRRLLAENGWQDTDGDSVLEKNGEPFEIRILTNQGNQLRSDIATMVQEYLRRVGVRVLPRQLEWSTFVEHLTQGDFDGCVFGWKTGTRADLTELWHSGSIPPNGYNIARYENAGVDSLIDAAKSAMTREVAGPLWRRVQAIIYEDQPALFIAVPYEVVGLRRGYCDVAPNALGFFAGLPRWYAAEKCP